MILKNYHLIEIATIFVILLTKRCLFHTPIKARSSLLEVFYKKCVLKFFAKFTEKTPVPESLSLKKLLTWIRPASVHVFSCEFWTIFKNIFFYRTAQGDCFCLFNYVKHTLVSKCIFFINMEIYTIICLVIWSGQINIEEFNTWW